MDYSILALRGLAGDESLVAGGRILAGAIVSILQTQSGDSLAHLVQLMGEAATRVGRLDLRTVVVATAALRIVFGTLHVGHVGRIVITAVVIIGEFASRHIVRVRQLNGQDWIRER